MLEVRGLSASHIVKHQALHVNDVEGVGLLAATVISRPCLGGDDNA